MGVWWGRSDAVNIKKQFLKLKLLNSSKLRAFCPQNILKSNQEPIEFKFLKLSVLNLWSPCLENAMSAMETVVLIVHYPLEAHQSALKSPPNMENYLTKKKSLNQNCIFPV